MEFVESYEKNGVHNFFGLNWHTCKAHPMCEVGAFLRTNGVSSEHVAKMSRESLEQQLLKLRLEARGFHRHSMWCCMKQEGIARVKVREEGCSMWEHPQTNGREVEQVEMEDE